jgi:NAD(P)-dependent dehydrogenase (short-subunit alcohol dehydrogenase family)
VWRALQFLDGGLDLLVHAASACAAGGLAELEIADWRRALAVQVDGPMYVTRECLDALREGERPLVVLLARSEALEATAGGAASAAAHAARGLAASWSKELGPAVRVAVIVRDSARSDQDIADAIARAWRERPAD